jgi:sugar phosphate isomerase/epimerase
MGIETFISEPQPEALDLIEKYCISYNIKLAIHNFREEVTSYYWDPPNILTACKNRSPLMGACGDFGLWIRSGMQPIDALKMLKERLITIQMHDFPLGDGIIEFDTILLYLKDSGINPALFGLESTCNRINSLPEIKKSIEIFNSQVQGLESTILK